MNFLKSNKRRGANIRYGGEEASINCHQCFEKLRMGKKVSN